MAKLQLQNNSGNLDLDAYIRFVTHVFVDNNGQLFDDYTNISNPDKEIEAGMRAAALAQFASEIGSFLRQEAPASGADVNENTCRVVGDRDRLWSAARPSRVTVPMPDRLPNNFSYLRRHLHQIFMLCIAANPYQTPLDPQRVRNIGQWNANAVETACRYLFGTMLLTRCR